MDTQIIDPETRRILDHNEREARSLEWRAAQFSALGDRSRAIAYWNAAQRRHTRNSDIRLAGSWSAYMGRT